MCLILIAHRAHPRYRLVVAANRDEFFRRPTAAADYWSDAPHVLGGRDLEKGGTWMGVAADGRWAAVTNFRDGSSPGPGTRSRGGLVAGYLCGSTRAPAYVASMELGTREYPGFNLLVADAAGVHYLSNKRDESMMLAAGFYGLSNHLLDSPWPKVERGKLALRKALAGAAGPDRLIERMMAALSDRSTAEDHALPSTGISKDWERRLSAAFIGAPGYGTRASTVLVMEDDGEVHFRERTFGERGEWIEDRRYRFASTQVPVSTPTQGQI
jgi:uncharacterized protein with NRDE domain